MANMCDNTLEFHCKVIPSWLKVDPETSHGISIDFEPRFLFLYNTFDELMQNEGLHWQDADGSHWFRIFFETKWCPPLDLYQSMMDDENILSILGRWCEPGCNVLGYINTEEGGIVEEEYPKLYCSEILDLDIFKSEPSDNYIELNGTESWITFEEYKTKIQEHLAVIPQQEKQLALDELKTISKYFKVKL